MTLVEAFRTIGPAVGPTPVRAARSTAASVLLAELLALRRRMFRADDDMADEAVNATMMNLVRTGPRGARYGDPDTEEGVRAYLIVMLGNAYKTLARSRRRWGFDGPEVDPRAPARDDLELELDLKRAAELHAWANDELRTVIIPAVAEDLPPPAGPDLRATLSTLIRIVDGAQTLDEAVAASIGPSDDRSREAMRQRFRRAKRRVCDWIVRAPHLSFQQREALVQALAELSLGGRHSAEPA